MPERMSWSSASPIGPGVVPAEPEAGAAPEGLGAAEDVVVVVDGVAGVDVVVVAEDEELEVVVVLELSRLALKSKNRT